MHRVRIEDLPFIGMSRQFVGAEQGGVAMCAYLVSAPPGKGPRLHRHPYDKVVFTQEGRGRWRINGEIHETRPGDMLVVKAGEPHGFTSIGDGPLVQIDVHLAPRFSQEWLE